MLDLISEILFLLFFFFLFLFRKRFFKKRKKEEANLVSDETNSSMHNHHEEGEMTKKGLPVCAGCHCQLEKGAVYELGKSWCTECYKTHVLKIKV
jgi:protein-arginine kinase activator protein McsA